MKDKLIPIIVLVCAIIIAAIVGGIMNKSKANENIVNMQIEALKNIN